MSAIAHSFLKMLCHFATSHCCHHTEIYQQCQNLRIMKLSLYVQKLLILHLVWKPNRRLQQGSYFLIMRFTLVLIWRNNFSKYGRAIAKSILGPVLTIVFSSNILSTNFLIHLLIKSGEYFSIKIIFNVSTSWWNLTKTGHKLKHQNNKI